MTDMPVLLKSESYCSLRTDREETESSERMIWVDTVFISNSNAVFAICVHKDGSVSQHKIEDIEVCEDAKPRILLDPEKLQKALRERMGGQSVAMPGMTMQGVTRQRIPAEQLRPGTFNYPGKVSAKEEIDDKEKEEM